MASVDKDCSDEEDEVVVLRPVLEDSENNISSENTAAQPADVEAQHTSEAADGLPGVEQCTQRPTKDAKAPQNERSWDSPSWWDRYVQIQYGHAVTVLALRLKGLGLRDADVESLCLALDGYVGRMLDPSLPISLDVDAAENGLSDRGGKRLMQWICGLFSRHYAGLRLRILKLYRNNVGDETCEVLARFVMAQWEAVEEIHLSHNDIRQRGFVAILTALAMHPGQVYPRDLRCMACPCWVRLEHNEITDVSDLLHCLQKEPVGLRVCLAPRNQGGQSCTSYQCCVGDGSFESTAHVHLYCVKEQSTTCVYARDRPGVLVRQYADIAEKVRDGKQALHVSDRKAELQLKVPTDLSLEGIVSFREVELRVDKSKGAGLELEADAYGYYVGSVEPEPGQELNAGDIITEIDGVPLWGDLGVDDLEEAFGSRFAAGARLRVVPQSSIRNRALLWPLGLPGEALSVNSRSEALRLAFHDDLSILGMRCGLHVAPELREDNNGIEALLLRGPARAQRWTIEGLEQLVAFYFPEIVAAGLARRRPRAEWWGEPDALSQPVAAAPSATPRATPVATVPTETAQGMGAWETSLRKQCGEDDDIHDEDLPCEPLEAPDDGPEVFEGAALMPANDLALAVRLVILVGLPGSGKSTLATKFASQGRWDVVNQDILGNRHACVAAAKQALQNGRNVVIDRCNISRLQRRVWLGVADDCKVGAAVIWLDADRQTCSDRVLQRFNHPTLPAESSSLTVIEAFEDRLEAPVEAEGFVMWHVQGDDELSHAFAELLELVEWSESMGNSSDNSWGNSLVSAFKQTAPTNGSGPSQADDQRRRGYAKEAGQLQQTLQEGSFRYRDARSGQKRAARAMYLRGVRRQIEYYFSDANLKQDWFFQEEIQSEPDPGWLEGYWIESCPRIKKVHQANEQDILEALGPSSLMVKQSGGKYWVRRGRPLPKLVAPRPVTGQEPEWYRDVHEAHGSAPTVDPDDTTAKDDENSIRCATCAKVRQKTDFSKAQLTKHRKSPVCKECVG
eukprot:TRINITY_DN6070_c0_g2_i1.p1 TRINITY_DN6070_c0_g2~~TRINITY_DN6070_c0_g2_i1.p1  ORF type:complete len:1021 (+),score=165.08 TRINITY_DN6070_c0_g2_i1:140-3202(+)